MAKKRYAVRKKTNTSNTTVSLKANEKQKNKINKITKETEDSTAAILDLTKSINKLLEKNTRYKNKYLVGLKSEENLEKHLDSMYKSRRKHLLSEIDLQEEIAAEMEDDTTNLEDTLIKHASKIEQLNIEIKKAKRQKELSEQFGEGVSKVRDFFKDIAITTAAITKDIASAIIIHNVADGAKQVYGEFAQITKETGIGLQNMVGMAPAVGGAYLQSMLFGASMQQVREATQGIVSEFGTISSINTKNIRDATLLMK